MSDKCPRNGSDPSVWTPSRSTSSIAVSVAGQSVRKDRKLGDSPHPLRGQFLGWGLIATFLVSNFVLLLGRAPTWQDEVFVQSTAWSMVHGGKPNLSVLAMYPRSISPERFYGPVSFQVAAALTRMFGLQTWPWRLICFLFGISLIVLSSALILHLVGARSCVVLVGASVIAISSIYCNPLPGRWDPVTIGLVMSGIAILLHAVSASWRSLACQSCGAGILFGLAVGSTPRALPPLAGVAFGLMVAVYLDQGKRNRLLVASAISWVSAAVVDTTLLVPIGMTPWSWYRFVSRASKGDHINSSPLLGGSWRLGLATNKLVIILAILMLGVGVISAIRDRRSGEDSGLIWKVTLTAMALASMAIEVLLVSTPIGAATFWLPFLGVSSFCWINSELARGSRVDILIQTMLCIELLLPGILEANRMFIALKLWRSRDPQVLLSEIKETIPARSIVFGPVGGYFFPVEQSGSQYLYLMEETTPGLSSGTDSPAYRRRSIDIAACTAPTFVVWPRGQARFPLPEEIFKHPRSQMDMGEGGFRDRPVIYRLWRPQNCSAIDPAAEALKAFGQP